MVRGQLDDAVAEADLLRPLARRAQEHFRGGTVGIFLEEMMFDDPGVIEGQGVGQFDLAQGLVQQNMFTVGLPRTRQLVFVKDTEFHGFPLPVRRRA